MGEHCSDHTAAAVRTVYAKAVFSADRASPLPLEAIFDHEDCVELIGPQEFGMEALLPDKTLLCLCLTKHPTALDELEALITGHSTACKPLASALAQGESIAVSIGGKLLTLPNGDSLPDQENLPVAARLAVLGAWCTGYRVVLYGSEDLL